MKKKDTHAWIKNKTLVASLIVISQEFCLPELNIYHQIKGRNTNFKFISSNPQMFKSNR